MGMASKEVMVTAPVVVLLFEDIFISRSLRQAVRDSWPLYVGLFSTWGLLLALNYNGPRSESAGFQMGVPVFTWWFLQAKVFWMYMKLAFWPWPLTLHYHLDYPTLAEAWPWLFALGTFALGAFVLLWRHSALGFVGVSMLAILSPTHVVPMIAEAAAERRMYLPLAALVPLVVIGGYALARRMRERFGRQRSAALTGSAPLTISFVCALALAAVFSFLDFKRIALYGDELSLWQDAEAHDPLDPVVHVFEGIALNQAGRPAEALYHFQRAVRMDPGSFLAQYNLARALEQRDQPKEAIGRYDEALRLNPKSAAAHHHLGDLLTHSGDKQKAIEHYRQAIALNADFTEAHSNLGIVLFDVGQIDAAIAEFDAAARLKPTIAAYRNLALAYSKANRPADAVATAVKALDLARSQGQIAVAGEIEAWLKSQQPPP
jgi:tetratricopeptide (TPR) repeat protein